LSLRNSYPIQTLFADTNALFHAFEKNRSDWLQFIESTVASGHRLVLTEEILYEFAGSGTLEAALHLARSVADLNPLWLRSFADILSDEVCHFARSEIESAPLTSSTVFAEHFYEISQLNDETKLTPEEFVRFEFEAMRDGRTQIAQEHASILNMLKTPFAKKQMTKEMEGQVQRSILCARLGRGSDLTARFEGAALESAVSLCVSKYKKLLEACPAYTTEIHLAAFRASDPSRQARPSDSNDYLMSIAAFPYVSIFLTEDGFLHDGLQYAKKRLPQLTTKLMRTPPM
jgi:hypothetical protein